MATAPPRGAFILLLLLLPPPGTGTGTGTGTGPGTGQSCGPAELPRDTVVGHPGADVTLSCWDEGPANVTVSWRMERRGTGGGHRVLGGGHTLVLRRLRPEDAGRYVCTGGGRRLRSLRLLVEDPPETPRVSCHRRSHEKDVVCEWGLRGTPAPGTRATLWVKERFGSEPPARAHRCRHFSKSRKFVCRVPVPPGADDTRPLVVSTCVTNAAGGVTGEDIVITLAGVLRPDPPVNVTVEAVAMSPQRLRVTWSYPPSWDPRFYWLRFQVRYRPEPAATFTQVDEVTRTWLDIGDAWRGTRHVAQVRAREEFGHGAWSHWSHEAAGTPWTDPADVTSRMGHVTSQFPVEVTPPPEIFGDDAADATRGAAVEASAGAVTPPYAVVAAGGGLILAIALAVAGAVRYRQLWGPGRGRAKAGGGGEGQHVLVPLGPPRAPPPLSDTPLLPPPGPPHILHITNLDYFFSGG